MAVTEVPGGSGNLAGQGCLGGLHEEEALARRRLDRAGWWRRGCDHLSSRLCADFRLSPLIFCVRFSELDHNTPGLTPSSFNTAFRDQFNVVRVGLNYRL